MNPNRKVYDDGQDGEPVTGPNLHALEGGGDSSEPARGHLAPADNSPSGEASQPETRSGLRGLEGGGEASEPKRGHLSDASDTDKSGGNGGLGAIAGGLGINPASFTPMGFVKGLFKGRGRKAAAGGGLGLGVIGLIIGALLIMIPLKIEHIVQNLEKHFFSSANQAVGDETDTMMKNWIKGPLATALRGGSCTKSGKTFISKDCKLNISGNSSNPVVNLYTAWSQAKLENDLADNYGIEIVYDKSGPGTYYLKAPGISGEEKIGDASGIGSDFDKVDRGTIRQAFKDAEKGMTLWDKMMFRYKVGRLLEEKYGIKRCIVYCGTQDALADKSNDKKYASKMFLVERVITPMNASVGAAVDCLLNGSCDTQQSGSSEACTQSSCAELAGGPESGAEVESEQEIGKVSATFGEETGSSLVKTVSDMKDAGGPTKYLLSKVLEKLGLQQFSDFAGGLVTWIPKLAQAITVVSKLGPDVKKLNYIVNSSAAVSLFMMYRTYADEIHTGHADITEVGSFNSSLGPGDQCATELEGNCTQQLGGTATAEAAPMYSTLMDGTSSTATTSPAATSVLNSILPAKAFADTTSSGSSSSYLCNDGKTVPSGQQVCDEEQLGRGNGALSALSSTFNNTPGLNYVTDAAKFLNGILSGPASLLGDVIGKVMGLLGISTPQFITNAVQPLITALATQVVNHPIGPDMSGGRTFDMMAAGADVSGNGYAHTGLGGQAMTPTQTAMIENQQENQAQQDFAKQPLFARLFNTNSQYSLVSKVAMDLPFGFPGSMTTSFAGIFENPFGNLANSFAAIFSGKVSAANPATQDAFDVTQYGYPNGVPSDPEAYWNQYCTDDPTTAYQKDNSWNTEASNTTDPNTGMPENNTTNPCLLIKATVGSAGGAFDQSLLTQDDTADLTGGTGGTTTPTPTGANGCTNPFPDGWVPNRLDMGYDGTFKNKIVAPCSGTIIWAGAFQGWNGSYGVELKLDQKQSLLPSSTLYFTEGVKPSVQTGQHVNAGDEIASAYPSPYGDAYGQGSSVGGIEWGEAQDGPVGAQTNTYVYGQCGTSAAADAVNNLDTWAQSIGVAKADTSLSDSHAGCP